MTNRIVIFLFVCISVNNFFVDCSPVQSDYITSLNETKSCKACQALVEFSIKINNNFGEELIKIFSQFCISNSDLKGKQIDRICSLMVRDAFGLFKNANPKAFCDEISACNTGLKVDESAQVSVNNNQTCQFCQDVVKNVKEIVSGEETEYQVKALASDACRRLGSFENECVSLLDEYLDTLFEFLRTSINPLQICQSLKACPSQFIQMERLPSLNDIVNIFPPGLEIEMPKTENQADKNQDQNAADDLECLLCKRIVNIILNELKDNRTEDAIVTALDHVCQLFPKARRDECQSFVERYTDELIHILTEETDPEMACTLLGVCMPKSVRDSLPTHEQEDNSKETISWVEIQPAMEVKADSSNVDESKSKYCFECELVMHFIQQEMYDSKSEEQIEEFIQTKVCDKVKVLSLKETCDTFVREYGPMIIQLIAQRVFDPTVVCQKELKICPNHTKSVVLEDILPTTESVSPSRKCSICISIVEKLDLILEDDIVEKETAQFIEHSCAALPKSHQDECRGMVEAYVPYFLQMIGRMDDAHQICKAIDVCYTEGHVHLLGGKKCTFGPQYWCHSISHAEACKATDFCKMKVWKPVEN